MPYDPNKDVYQPNTPGANSFGRRSALVTPSDSADLPGKYCRVICATAGNIAVVPVDNGDTASVPFTSVPAGFIPPFWVKRVMSTGTTATVYTIDF